METVSLKKVDAKTREYIKKRVIHLYEKKTKYAVIADTLNISYDAVSRIVRSYKQNGCLLKEKTRGRKKGEKRTLSVEQEREIQRLIIDKYPDQMKLGFALWTRAAVKELIQRLYGIHMPMRSISNYLNRWGLTCQRPAKRAISQDDVKRKTFMEKEYPAIAKRAKKENAVIYWGDETGINARFFTPWHYACPESYTKTRENQYDFCRQQPWIMQVHVLRGQYDATEVHRIHEATCERCQEKGVLHR